MYNGIINIYKEKGYTSHDVVAVLRGILKMKRIGHTGTLDPEATGVLPVCLGKATKLAEYLVDKEKTYLAKFCLGIETDTQDHTGEVVQTKDASGIGLDDLVSAAAGFTGELMQVPPMFSAVKVNGKRLYELARQGKTVERKARPVMVHVIDQLALDGNIASMRVVCSKGTYIRTLCHDIGNALGCGAHMTELERTQSGPFSVDDSLTLDEVRALSESGGLAAAIRPIDSMFPDFLKLHVIDAFGKALINGNKLPPEAVEEKLPFDDNVRYNIYDGEERYIGLYVFKSEESRFKPVKLFI